jgi:hypothetical protein
VLSGPSLNPALPPLRLMVDELFAALDRELPTLARLVGILIGPRTLRVEAPDEVFEVWINEGALRTRAASSAADVHIVVTRRAIGRVLSDRERLADVLTEEPVSVLGDLSALLDLERALELLSRAGRRSPSVARLAFVLSTT